MPRRIALALCLLLPAAAAADGDPKAVSFEKDVLPVFKQHCFSCHDAKKQTASLRLDVRKQAFAGGESGAKGIVPGKPDESEVVKRLLLPDDDDLQMPPKGPLAKGQIEAVRAWVRAGAKWPDALANEESTQHWAFVPPARPAVPAGAAHPIDAFVRAKLAAEGLKPSPPADKITLIRRLYLDLLGLPPTVAEVDTFVTDNTPDAYAKLVARLLASPHYGERWARVWLDAARYADSDGFEKDKPRFVWSYRDWVIRSFNTDVPYDRFVRDQIAGDLMQDTTQDQIVATGFLRNSMINEEGGADPEQFRMEAMFDRMDAVGKAVLGLTVQCAQCHTHKYDPLTHAEYYRLFAFLNNAHEANVAVYSPEELRTVAAIREKAAAAEADLKHRVPDWQEKLAAWEATARGGQPKWDVIAPTIPDESTGGSKYLKQPDGSFLALGYAPTKHGVKLEFPAAGDIAAFRLELLTDPNLPRGGPGRSTEGTAMLTEFEATYTPPGGKSTKVKFRSATADCNPPERPLAAMYADKSNKKRVTGGVAFAIDGKDETAWTTDTDPGRRNVPRKAVFVPEAAIPAGSAVTVVLRQNHGGWNSDDNQNCNLGRVRLSVTAVKDAVADPLPAAVRNIIESVAPEKRTVAQRQLVFAYWRTVAPEGKDTTAAIDAAYAGFPTGATQLVLAERAEPRPTNVLKRGDFLKPAEAVGPGTPAFLHKLDGLPPDRRGLAAWLTDRQSPTTARAIVNRVWQAYFGAGMMTTPEDFGRQAAAPSHPELLDWLAVEFMESGWSLKKLHTLIVSSETYRQSSKVTAEALATDPQNRLLARGPRFRADAEIVRDIALSAAGLLNTTVGGPSVYPPVPEFLMKPPASYGPKAWPESTGPDRYRRSLYVFRFRSIPYPPLQAFDAPTGDFACVARARSNTPLMALTGLNEPVFVEAARGLARRGYEAGTDDATRLTAIFRRCVSRLPTGDELKVLADVLAKERKRYAAAGAKPAELLGDGKLGPQGLAATEAAAWVAVARVVLNLDETVTKD